MPRARTSCSSRPWQYGHRKTARPRARGSRQSGASRRSFRSRGERVERRRPQPSGPRGRRVPVIVATSRAFRGTILAEVTRMPPSVPLPRPHRSTCGLLLVVCAFGCATDDQPGADGTPGAGGGGTNPSETGAAGTAGGGASGSGGAMGGGSGGAAGALRDASQEGSSSAAGTAGSAGATGSGGGGTGGSGGVDPNCHVDCFGGADCYGGVVTTYYFGPCPCTHCSGPTSCIARTFRCSGACASERVRFADAAAELCALPDAGPDAGTD
jgi:hypothetical protein